MRTIYKYIPHNTPTIKGIFSSDSKELTDYLESVDNTSKDKPLTLADFYAVTDDSTIVNLFDTYELSSGQNPLIKQ